MPRDSLRKSWNQKKWGREGPSLSSSFRSSFPSKFQLSLSAIFKMGSFIHLKRITRLGCRCPCCPRFPLQNTSSWNKGIPSTISLPPFLGERFVSFLPITSFPWILFETAQNIISISTSPPKKFSPTGSPENDFWVTYLRWLLPPEKPGIGT